MPEKDLEYVITHTQMMGILDAFMNFDTKALTEILSEVRKNPVDKFGWSHV